MRALSIELLQAAHIKHLNSGTLNNFHDPENLETGLRTPFLLALHEVAPPPKFDVRPLKQAITTLARTAGWTMNGSGTHLVLGDRVVPLATFHPPSTSSITAVVRVAGVWRSRAQRTPWARPGHAHWRLDRVFVLEHPVVAAVDATVLRQLPAPWGSAYTPVPEVDVLSLEAGQFVNLPEHVFRWIVHYREETAANLADACRACGARLRAAVSSVGKVQAA